VSDFPFAVCVGDRNSISHSHRFLSDGEVALRVLAGERWHFCGPVAVLMQDGTRKRVRLFVEP
jgi:hypothetical protein